MKHITAIVFLTLFAALCTSTAMAANMRIATLSMPKIYKEFPDVQKATLYLKSRKESFQKDLDTGTKSLYGMMKEIKDQRGKLPEEEIKKREQQWRRMKFDLDLKFQKMKEQLQKLEEHEFDSLKQRINAAITTVVRAKRVDLVIEKQWLYFGETTDLTDEVLALLLKEANSR